MTFGRVHYYRKNIIFFKNVGKKTTNATLKVHDMKRERFDMFR